MRNLNETETRAELIDPKLREAGWGNHGGFVLRREYSVWERGAGKADYVLFYEGRALAVIEAKKLGRSCKPAIKQVIEYARALKAPYAYATNGAEIYQILLRENRNVKVVGRFASPQELSSGVLEEWRRREKEEERERIAKKKRLREQKAREKATKKQKEEEERREKEEDYKRWKEEQLQALRERARGKRKELGGMISSLGLRAFCRAFLRGSYDDELLDEICRQEEEVGEKGRAFWLKRLPRAATKLHLVWAVPAVITFSLVVYLLLAALAVAALVLVFVVIGGVYSFFS